MKKTSYFVAALCAASLLGLSTKQAQGGGSRQSAGITTRQAQARMAELDAQAAARSRAAYEQAWRDTRRAAGSAVDQAKLLYNPTPVGVLQYLWDKPVQRIERRPPSSYQSIPPIRPPELRDFRNLAPRR